MLEKSTKPTRVQRVIGYALVVLYVAIFAFVFAYVDSIPALILFFAGVFPLGWLLKRLKF